jgi:DNA polymerase IV
VNERIPWKSGIQKSKAKTGATFLSHNFRYMQNVVMHLDMNSYFASCEQQDNFSWRGKPVGVCEHLGGIIIGASVEAKKWGITTGTPVWEARKLYPKIILTHTHPDRYRHYTKKMIKVVSDYTDKVEVYSIDEVFMDISASCNVKIPISNFQFSNKSQFPNSKKYPGPTYLQAEDVMPDADPFEEAANIAREIKKRITAEVGDWLRCSIGIAENKLLAKIASDMKKPDGLVIIGNNDKIDKSNCIILSKNQLYDQLRLVDVPGIGRRMEKKLNELGIKTLVDLKNYSKSKLVALFGLPGYHLYNLGQLEGSFKPAVEEEESIKSIGHMYTLPLEFREPKFFVPVLYKLSEMAARRLRRQKLMGNVLHIHVHDKDGKCFGKSRRLGYYLWDGREIFAESVKVLESWNAVPRAGAMLIGVTIAGLVDFIEQQSLFGSVERQLRVAAALDKINEKYGDFAVCRVPVLSAGRVIRDSVGFGRIKEL